MDQYDAGAEILDYEEIETNDENAKVAYQQPMKK